MANSKADLDMSKNVLNGRQQTILDVFRVVAAFSVLIGHSFVFYRLSIFKDQTYFPFIQNIGVIIFFLMSGFLTVFSLERKNSDNSLSFSKFFTYKTVRIAKEYLPGLMMIAAIDWIAIAINKEGYSYYEAFSVKQFVGNIFMLHNMGPSCVAEKLGFVPFGSGRPLWTLAVEWWLYMLFGALYLSLNNRREVSLPKLAVFGGIIFMCSDYLTAGRGNGLGFVFALGVLGYYAYGRISQKTAKMVFVLSCLAYLLYGLKFKEAYTMYSFIILWVIFCSAMRIGGGMEKKTKRNPLLAFISKGTFMLYITHYSILDLIVHADVPWSVHTKFWVGILISLIVAYAAYYVFGEKDVIGSVCNVIKRKASKE